MIEIVIDNVFTEVRNASKEIEHKIWQALSFEVKEFSMSPGYKQPKVRHLFNRKTKLTYTGLFPYVMDIINQEKEKYQIIDTRVKYEPNANFKLVEYLDKEKKIKLEARDYQKNVITKCRPREIIQSTTGSGKSLSLDTRIITPSGFKLMRDIHPGDIVYDEEGNRTKVLKEFPQGELDVYRVTFEDGSTVKCSEDHLWKYKNSLTDTQWQVNTLKEILEKGLKVGVYIPVAEEVEFDKVEDLLDPNTIGKNIKVVENEENERFRNAVKNGFHEELDKFFILNGQLINIFNLSKKSRRTMLYAIIMEFGEPMESSYVLEGSETVLFIVRYLANSLGKCCSQINNKLVVNETNYHGLQMTSVEKIGREEMKCIEVDSDHHTYLCENCIVTHNTFMMAGLITKFNVKPVAVFADKISLCTQLQAEFSKFLGEEVGLVGGGIEDVRDITVYSAQSATEEMVKDTKLMMVDECFVYETEIRLANGTKKQIGEMVETHGKMEAPYRVTTYNVETGQRENKSVKAVAKVPLIKGLKAVLIRNEQKKITKLICTEEHMFYCMNRKQYVKVSELENTDQVRFVDGSLGEVFKVVDTPRKEEYVYDIEVEGNHNYYANGVLVHNCHHTPSNTIAQISRWCKDAYYRIGVSATPWRDDGSDLLIDAVFMRKNEKIAVNTSSLIKLGYLTPCTIYWIAQNQVYKSNSNYHALYTNAIVKNRSRNMDMVKVAYQMRKFKDAIILVLIQRVEHGEILLDLMNQYIENIGFSMNIMNNKTGKNVLVRCNTIEFLSGQDDALKREAVIQGLKERKCKILIASTIADEGLDIPSIDVVILGGSGKSSTRCLQRVGRALRLYTNPETGKKKERAIIFDFMDKTPIFRRQARARDKMYNMEPEFNVMDFPSHLLGDIKKLK